MDGSDIFNKGASIPREVYLYNYDTEGPLDLDTLTEITFEVIHAITNRTLGTYTLGDSEVVKQDAANGLAWFHVGQTVSATGKRGWYLLKVTTEETDASYESNTRIRTGMSLCFKLR